jgi:hypothetical protein
MEVMQEISMNLKKSEEDRETMAEPQRHLPQFQNISHILLELPKRGDRE